MSLLNQKHAAFLRHTLKRMPASAASLDTSRLTVVFFAVSGLDLLSEDAIPDQMRTQIIEWIYRQQIDSPTEPGMGRWGFRGSAANGCHHYYDVGHLAMTYCALASLIILGDDLERVNRTKILQGLKELQLETGSFAAAYGSESDMRFLYCAVVICYLLNDWSSIDVSKSVQFIRSSLTYEGAFAQGPEHEAHGGSTFCAVASLMLMNQLDQVLNRKQIESLKRWCVFKQVEGFAGRPNKDPDTCYSFWIGATLKLLSAHDLINQEKDVEFARSAEDGRTGGIAKYSYSYPDVLHTFLCLSGLSLHNNPGLGLKEVDPAINISKISLSRIASELQR